MKKFMFIAFFIISGWAVLAQVLNPVFGTFTTKKISDKEYDVQMVATIQWWQVSHVQPEDAIAQPTTISFNKNPLVDFAGKVKEVGKLREILR